LPVSEKILRRESLRVWPGPVAAQASADRGSAKLGCADRGTGKQRRNSRAVAEFL